MELTKPSQITEDDVLKLDSDARIEVINGEMVEMTPVGGLHHFIAGNFYRRLDAFVLANKLGYVFMDGLIYLMFKKSKGLQGALVPDVSFISKAAIPANWQIHLPFPGAPTLAIEVMSPGDDAEKMLAKVRIYLNAGTEQVWVVYPEQKELHQYSRSSPETVRVYTSTETFTVESLFPGLTISMQDVFTVPNLTA